MNNNSFWAVAFGAVLGGATVMYLNTKEGKKITKKTNKKLKKYKKNAQKVLSEQSDMIAKKANDTIHSAKGKMEDFTHTAEDMVGKTKNSFAKGMDAAKHAIQEKMHPSEKV